MVIYRFSKFYFLLRIYAWIMHRLFYKRVLVLNKANIPKDKPVIFAPNHQNALMDPLAIIFTQKRQTVFLARADIFKKKFVSWLLTRLKILPVYRIRDGAENLKRNDLTFEKSYNVLKKGGALSLFPEAAHNNKRSLLALKKAIPRIAFDAEKKSGYTMDIHVIPVGIYYSNYTDAHADLIVNYGKPIKINDYKDLIEESERKATIAFNEVLTESISAITLNIPDEGSYEIYEEAREILAPEICMKHNQKFSIENKFKADMQVVESLKKAEKVNVFLGFKEKVNDYLLKLKDLKIDDAYVRRYGRGQNIFLWAFLMYFSPVFIYGLILNILPYFYINRMVKMKLKDTQFHSTFKYGLGIFLYPIYYLILLGIFLLIFGYSIWFWIFFASLPLTAYFSYVYYQVFLRYRKMDKYNLKNEDFQEVLEKREKVVVEYFENIVSLKTLD